ncbi:[FeFe] hydrogenase H-cluster maturation GTPase HydF [Peptoniphilus lacrimalis]|uniref:[FeFe] hydrogenase H-cluster maturation GTPase HydF n=1 Tax=Peptoniphilus lacrimalis TaxID=33031 RepID=UPI00050E6920|nr:[FeFe] hydrogenase H-cluster maturation GTPase HydF [Peptoniphilus lacrimalis]KGF29361.1 GTP-binding protein [Peptoniphilus lacrimalis DNF00528]MDK7722863.1 [FeFe] hydrogenase H-cluster maturation GTPase HydF [Peptoniphilus lacrimalis]MDK7732465.1 [FeFe] hydrogenase H-cluster maturation GTPase HydF [Peptoniphilus lacrimalis]
MEVSKGNRIHIGIFGKVNSGKSSLINLLAAREVSIVSDREGTTTDSVYKSMEFLGLGPVTIMDTPGICDKSFLGKLREQRLERDIEKADIAIILFSDSDIGRELELIKKLKKSKILLVINKVDILSAQEKENIYKNLKDLPFKIIEISTKEKNGIEELKKELVKLKPEEAPLIFDGLVKKGDRVLLIMPQDIAAPKKRLILPQVESIRELLDREALLYIAKVENMEDMLSSLKEAPDLIVTDSQVFQDVYKLKPEKSKLTSFSVLFAKMKGDIDTYIKGTEVFSKIDENSKILIAECCTHAPLSEDIGRVKIPNMLKKKYGENLQVDFQSGASLPKDIEKYDLIIQCGGCMLTRNNILNRIEKAKVLNVPITNYGLTIAYFKKILDKITI